MGKLKTGLKLGLISIESELKELNEYEFNYKFQALSLVHNGVNLSIKDISIYPYSIQKVSQNKQ